jgi:hypothetical protein
MANLSKLISGILLLVSSQSFAEFSPPIFQGLNRPPAICAQQAQQAALGLEQVFVAPHYRPLLTQDSLHITKIVNSVGTGGSAGLNHWAFTVAFTVSDEGKMGNPYQIDANVYEINLTQNGADDCYYNSSKSL